MNNVQFENEKALCLTNMKEKLEEILEQKHEIETCDNPLKAGFVGIGYPLLQAQMRGMIEYYNILCELNGFDPESEYTYKRIMVEVDLLNLIG